MRLEQLEARSPNLNIAAVPCTLSLPPVCEGFELNLKIKNATFRWPQRIGRGLGIGSLFCAAASIPGCVDLRPIPRHRDLLSDITGRDRWFGVPHNVVIEPSWNLTLPSSLDSHLGVRANNPARLIGAVTHFILCSAEGFQKLRELPDYRRI